MKNMKGIMVREKHLENGISRSQGKVREFVVDQRNVEMTCKYREKSGNLKINGQGSF